MKVKRSFISILLCLALLLMSFATLFAVQVTAADTTKKATGNSNTGELVLKAWNWPISVIQENLDAIADAGFTVIETSAVNGIVGSGNSVKEWYEFYQPTNYNIGNKIGTEAEFKSLCSSANAKGIKIIVDVVLNHTTDQTSMVDSSLKHWHSSTNSIQGDDYNDRYKVTQWRQSGMPDLDTSRSDIQAAANTFLKRMITDGASGFRFDAAKHIELPSKYDGAYNCASDYWPNALNGVNASFMYGEVLGGTNANEYMNYMKITNSGYSGNVRSAIQQWKLPSGTLTNYDHGADPDYLVSYVETHDNYVDGNYGMSNFQVQLAYAAMASMGNNCMYLARPAESSPTAYTSGRSNYYGSNYVYDGGDGAYLLPQVAEVNKFHNAMSGKPSYVYNINNNDQVLAVQRGNDGVCIINAGSSAQTFTINTGMPNGTYTDKINGTSFTVSNGNLSGTVQGGKIYPIYGSGSTSSEVSLSDCYLHGWIGGQDYTGTDYHFNSSGSLTATLPAGDNYVYISANGTDYNSAAYVDQSTTGTTTGNFFTGNGEKMKVPGGVAVTFTLAKNGSGFTLSYPKVGSGSTEPETPTTESVVYLNPNANWKSAGARFAIYVYNSSKSAWAGMSYDSVSGYYKATIPSGTWSNIIFCRMNGSTTANNWDNKWNQTGDLSLSDNIGKCYNIPTGDNVWDCGTSGSWSTYTPPATKYDYTVKYQYSDDNNVTKTITKTVLQSELTNASQIAALNDPASRISNMKYTYTLGTASKSGTTITAYMQRSENKYTVTLNGTTVGSDYKYLDKALVTSPTETGFIIDGHLIKTGTALEIYVTGDIDITTDSTVAHQDTTSIDLMATYFSDDKVSYELLATANVENFARMGVAFAADTKTQAQIASAVNAVTSGTAVSSKIAVHNSQVDFANSSGLYQFTYAPYLTNVPSGGATLYFYTYAVTKSGTVVVSDAVSVSVPNSLA